MTNALPQSATVIVPARNEGPSIARVIGAVLAQRPAALALDVIVVDNASTDDTAARAAAAGARVLHLPLRQGFGNPAAARNLAARASTAEILVFLDADCLPEPDWLAALLQAHGRGEAVVGGPLELPDGLPLTARLDYYCGWYHAHGQLPAGPVVSQPPGNLSVRRDLFMATSGFIEEGPAAYAHEELLWQAELATRGHRIHYEPAAVVLHHNRPGFGNLLRRNYRWGYSAIQVKSETGAARMAWLYRHPRLLMLACPPLAVAQTGYVIACWLKARRFEPLVMLPLVFAARAAWCAGAFVGTARWLRHRAGGTPGARPAWE
jgi:mycofactocin glycosyltransferase